MRKTVQINDLDLHKRMKLFSAETGMTVGEIAEKGIRLLISKLNRDSRSIFERICSETVTVEFDDLGREEKNILDKEISSLELSTRVKSHLNQRDIRYVGQLIKMERRELKAKGFGSKSLNEVSSVLDGFGLKLNAPITGWINPDHRTDSDKKHEYR